MSTMGQSGSADLPIIGGMNRIDRFVETTLAFIIDRDLGDETDYRHEADLPATSQTDDSPVKPSLGRQF